MVQLNSDTRRLTFDGISYNTPSELTLQSGLWNVLRSASTALVVQMNSNTRRCRLTIHPDLIGQLNQSWFQSIFADASGGHWSDEEHL